MSPHFGLRVDALLCSCLLGLMTLILSSHFLYLSLCSLARILAVFFACWLAASAR